MIKKLQKIQHLIFILLFVITVAFLLWKVPYGFGSDDEPFYFTIPQRLLLGDHLFTDEWHVSQLTSFFLYPIVSVYYRIVGSLDGLVIAARYVYVAGHSAVSLYTYFRLRKFGIGAIAGALLFMIFAPFDIMTYCYNTIALDLLLLSGVTIACADPRSQLSAIFSGFFFAGAVVVCPYLAAVYFLFFIAVLSLSLHNGRHSHKPNPAFSFRLFLFFSVGIGIMALLFAVFFFRFADISGLLENVSYILNDPEHPPHSLLWMVKHYIYNYLNISKSFTILLLLYTGLLGICLLLHISKKTSFGFVVFLGSVVLCLLAYISFLPSLENIAFNYIVFPIVMPGLTAFIFLKEKPWQLFYFIFIPGLLYSCCVGSTSNLDFKVISMAFSISNVASVCFIVRYCRQCIYEYSSSKTRKRLSLIASGIVIIGLFGLEAYVKATHCLWTCPVSEMTQMVQHGPGKGLIESDALIEYYNRLYHDASYLQGLENGRVLVFSESSWGYLILQDYPYGTFSSWLSELNNTTVERLRLYYSVNPTKTPKYIWIEKNLFFNGIPISELILEKQSEYGYNICENDNSYILIYE